MSTRYPFGDCDDSLGTSYDWVKRNLVELGVEQIDLVLLHAPCRKRARNIEQWRGLERALDEGLTRAIGVSNYNKADLALLLSEARVPPAVNQCEMNLEDRDDEAIAFAQANNITYEAFDVIRGCPWDHPVAKKMAEEKGVSVAMICMRWAVERGVALAVGLGQSPRMAQHARDNLAVFSFSLSAEQVAALEAAVPLKPRKCGDLWHEEDGYCDEGVKAF